MASTATLQGRKWQYAVAIVAEISVGLEGGPTPLKADT